MICTGRYICSMFFFRQGDMYSSFIAIDPKVQGVSSPGSRSITIPSFKKWNVTNQEESLRDPATEGFLQVPLQKHLYNMLYHLSIHVILHWNSRVTSKKQLPPENKKKVVKQASQKQERITSLTTLDITIRGLEASHVSPWTMDFLFFACPDFCSWNPPQQQTCRIA